MNRVAVFAHYDRNNIIQDYVLYYLKELKKICSIVIFVSDCIFPESEIKKLDGISDFNITEKHGEYDFGSYKRGYQLAEEKNILQKTDELIFANDSCYGPLYPLEDIFEKMEQKTVDFWGMTENEFGFDHTEETPEIKPHIQSYFMVFKKNVFLSECFESFISSIKKEKDKDDVIRKYEVGLTPYLVENGYSCKSFVGETWQRNIILEEPVKLIKNGFPFLKTSICRGKNPQFLTLFYKSFLKKYTNYPVHLIEKDAKNNRDKNFRVSFWGLKKLLFKIRLKQRKVFFLGEWYNF